MDKKESKKKDFFKKLLSPYRMVVINEETFEERVQYRITKLSIILGSIFTAISIASIIYLFIAYTPLKEYIPGYDSSELRKKAVQNLFITDSLITLYNQNLQYLNAVKAVLNEEILIENPELPEQNLQSENQERISFVTTVPEDSLLRAFVSQQDKYNPELRSSIAKIEPLLLPPALGPISQQFNLEEEHYAVDIVLKKNTPIKAILEGRVIFAEWTAQTGHVIIVEHNKGILSVYKHNSSLSKKQGDVGSWWARVAARLGLMLPCVHLNRREHRAC